MLITAYSRTIDIKRDVTSYVMHLRYGHNIRYESCPNTATVVDYYMYAMYTASCQTRLTDPYHFTLSSCLAVRLINRLRNGSLNKSLLQHMTSRRAFDVECICRLMDYTHLDCPWNPHSLTAHRFGDIFSDWNIIQ